MIENKDPLQFFLETYKGPRYVLEAQILGAASQIIRSCSAEDLQNIISSIHRDGPLWGASAMAEKEMLRRVINKTQ